MQQSLRAAVRKKKRKSEKVVSVINWFAIICLSYDLLFSLVSVFGHSGL